MVRRIVSMVSIGLIIVVMLEMSGCCDFQCEMDKKVAENREKWAAISRGESRADTAQSSCGNERDSGFDTGMDTAKIMEDAEGCAEHAFPQSTQAEKTTAGNGFVYPMDSITSWKDTYDYAGFGACGSSYYYTNTCHNGTDIGASRGTSVYAIAAGTVVKVSGTQNSTCSSGWGYDYGGSSTCNMAVAMQHYAADGTPFVVVYGHLVYDSTVSVGDSYVSGETIGSIANDYDWSATSSTWKKTSSAHLHFGVFPGTSSPSVTSTAGWGKLTCKGASQSASAAFPASCSNNGSTAPGTYIGAKSWVEPPSAPSLSSPGSGARVSSPVTLGWSNGSGTYRVHIMVCTNSSLTSGCMNPDGDMTGAEPSTAFATSYSASLSKGTYYWAVRGIAYQDDGGWGSYSAVRSFTVK